MHKDKIISPVTLSSDAFIDLELSSSKIIIDYKSKYHVDVTRFFKNSPSSICIYKCEKTGYRFYYPFDLAGDGKFYDQVMKNSPYYPEWKHENDIAYNEISRVKGHVKVLDVGCGKGVFLEHLRKKGINSTGLEFNDTAIKICKQKELEVHKKSIEEYSTYNKEKYDVVCTFQVLEHVPEVYEFISSCLECLKPGGRLIISVPNNTPYYAGYNIYATGNIPPHHMGLWNLDSLKKLERFYPITLIKHDYDLKISFAKKLFFKSSYMLMKKTGGIKMPVINNILILLISVFFFPAVFFDHISKKSSNFGRVIVIFEKDKI